ncbi:AraC family transcriptional regulator [Motilimonas cestriensis]|uniref:AraC family transcriptional regulator n=1 Tax=Motilimonas cestriensis TaxID=2742685 RepID=A0ABS8WFY8_9GAMM|nr:AraC family transcriptional regulator [Motilimonas cestriensis]MCE2596661.1 AraC family transcriptional regulator [Motilimonas cestriensis]
MSNVSTIGTDRPPFSRIIRVLEYIHQHLDQPLSVEQIASKSCWSRWQLQRVFLHETGFSVANYVREIKLSRAAELLVATELRVIDIALALGFGSEMSFSRAFKNMFDLSPRAYKKRGVLTGLRKPLEVTKVHHLPKGGKSLTQVRIETRAGFYFSGIDVEISGVLSPQPNFQQRVPLVWQQFHHSLADVKDAWPFKPTYFDAMLGVIDTTQVNLAGGNLRYWAALGHSMSSADMSAISQIITPFKTKYVPEQTYAVVTHRGPIRQLAATIEWFLLNWLPESGYRGLDGYELEVYPVKYDGSAEQACMEYWLPVMAKGESLG